MADPYANVSAGGLWDTIKGTVGGALNSVGNSMAPPTGVNGQPINPGRFINTKDVKHAVGNTVLSARDAIVGQDQVNQDKQAAGIIPAPADGSQPPAQQAPTPITSDQSQGAIPTPPDPNSQAGGAAAQSTQQEQLDKSKQQVADDTLKGGGVPTPVTTDPATALATRNQNIQSGVGNTITGQNTVDTPQALTDQQQKNATLQKTGDDTFKSMNTIGDWFQSPSFLMGMMQTGLSLLDGKGFAESFKTGSDYFDQHYGMEQRKSWADDLLQKGYDRQQIQQYIETGDSKILKSPAQLAAEQQAQQINLATAQENLNTLQYNNSPEQRAAAAERQNIVNQNMQAQSKQMQAEAEWKTSPAYRQGQQELLQSQIEYNKGRADKASMAGNVGGVNVVTLPTIGPDGKNLTASVTGAEVMPDTYVLSDSKAHLSKDSRWMQAVNIKTGDQVTVPVNPQMYEVAATNADNTISTLNQMNAFGKPLFGVTGEIRRDIYDMLGQRSSEDLASLGEELQGQVDNLAESRATLESGGFKPTNVALQNAKSAFPTFGHYDREGNWIPVKVSGKRFAQMVQSIGKQAAQMKSMATRYSTPASQEAVVHEQFQVHQGDRQRAPDGKYYIAVKSGDKRENIWKLDPNQGD